MKIFKFIVSIFFICTFLFQCETRYLSNESQLIHEKFWFAENEYLFKYLMAGSPHQTPLFHFKGNNEGPAVLIIGGTHGNEPAGFEAAHRLLDFLSQNRLKQGHVFIIPEANRLAIIENNRRVPVPDSLDREFGNLNRCYPGKADGLPMQQLAYEVMQFIKEMNIDVVIDLHESPVFHLEHKEESTEYHGLGQTIIYTPNEAATWLVMVALDHLNTSIPPGIKQFSSAERPILNSAAWAAGKYFNIPGFTTETCKQLPLEERIDYHLEIVKVILKEKQML